MNISTSKFLLIQVSFTQCLHVCMFETLNVLEELFVVTTTWTKQSGYISWQYIGNEVEQWTIRACTEKLTSAFEFLTDGPLHNTPITRHRHQQLLSIRPRVLGAALGSDPFQLPHRSHVTTVHSATNTQWLRTNENCFILRPASILAVSMQLCQMADVRARQWLRSASYSSLIVALTSTALDYLPLGTEPLQSPLLISGTIIYLSTWLLHLCYSSSSHSSRVKTHLFTISHPSTLPCSVPAQWHLSFWTLYSFMLLTYLLWYM